MSAHNPNEERALRFARLLDVEARANARSSLGAFATLYREPVSPITIANVLDDVEMRCDARRAYDREIDRAGLVNDAHRCFQTGRFATAVALVQEFVPLRVAA